LFRKLAIGLENVLMALMTKQSISVVFPAHNEEGNIAKAVEQAIHCLEHLSPDWEIIPVNDGSSDNTGEIIQGLSRQYSRVKGVHHEANRGYGAALKSGIQSASKELIFFCDSDLQFHLYELLHLLIWIEQFDLVIGYRAKRNDRLHRVVNAFGWKVLVSNLLGLKVRDIDCAFKLFRRVVFQAIEIDAVGAMVNTDILVQASRMGFKIKEVPVTHFPRVEGEQSGARLRVIAKAFRELLILYRKLRNIHPIVLDFDRRRTTEAVAVEKRILEDRRKVMMPINFPDRRRRFLLLDGVEVPMSTAAGPERGFHGE
jgi:glycosyltransferase involved in cell wall biosynthesis